MRIFFASLAALLVAGCQTSNDPVVLKPAPPADPASIIKPAKSVPTSFARFSGVWQGVWGEGLDSNLAIQTISTGGDISGTYAWGSYPKWRIEPGMAPTTGKIEGATLTLGTFRNGAVVVYVHQDDDTLLGTYSRKDDVTKGLFKKLKAD